MSWPRAFGTTSSWQGFEAAAAKDILSDFARFRAPGASAPHAAKATAQADFDRLGPARNSRESRALGAGPVGPMTSLGNHPHALPFAAPIARLRLRVRCRGRPPPSGSLSSGRVATAIAARGPVLNEKSLGLQPKASIKNYIRGGRLKIFTANTTDFADGSQLSFLRTSQWAISCRVPGGAQ